jgi:hypothetical protein
MKATPLAQKQKGFFKNMLLGREIPAGNTANHRCLAE